MRGRRKGGAPKSPNPIQIGMGAHAAAFLSSHSARVHSQPSIDGHRWSLRQFASWAVTVGMEEPAAITHSYLEGN